MKGSSYSLRVMKNAKQFSKHPTHHLPTHHEPGGASSLAAATLRSIGHATPALEVLEKEVSVI